MRALPPSARSNGSCGFPASRFPPLLPPGVIVRPDPMRVGPVVPRYPPYERWVFRTRNSPTCPYLLAASQRSPTQRSTGPSPSPEPFAPGGAAARGSDPRLFVVATFLSHMPRSDSWHRFGWNFARASIHTYLPAASGRGLRSLWPALSSAGVARFRPYLPLGRYQVSLGHTRLFPTVSPAHTLVRRGGTHTPSPPSCRLDHSSSVADRFICGIAPIDYNPVVLRKPFRPHLAVGALPSGT